MVATKSDNINGSMGWVIAQDCMVEQNSGGEREHTKKWHENRIKAWEKRQSGTSTGLLLKGEESAK